MFITVSLLLTDIKMATQWNCVYDKGLLVCLIEECTTTFNVSKSQEIRHGCQPNISIILMLIVVINFGSYQFNNNEGDVDFASTEYKTKIFADENAFFSVIYKSRVRFLFFWILILCHTMFKFKLKLEYILGLNDECVLLRKIHFVRTRISHTCRISTPIQYAYSAEPRDGDKFALPQKGW